MGELVRILRGPRGCPWDQAQDVQSLAGHLIEESFEVLHAAQDPASGALGEELGDAFFLFALTQAAAEEEGAGSLDEIVARSVRKIVKRHPHVFSEKRTTDPRAAALEWEERKRAERGEGGTAGGEVGAAERDAGETGEAEKRAGAPPQPDAPGSIAAGDPALPALLQAQRMQEKAAVVGFDWPDPEPVLDKIEEELAELRAAMRAAPPERDARVREELGDLLFAVVNLARLLRANPEDALRRASAKFRNRFNHMAALAATRGTPLGGLSLEEMESCWQEIKRGESGPAVR